MQIFFLVFSFEIVFSAKTEIRFTIDAPSLFRCRKNGPVFYFPSFPTDELYSQTMKNSSKNCDLTLLLRSQRAIFTVDRHVLRCGGYGWSVSYRISEVLVFKAGCSVDRGSDLCLRSTPTRAMIIADSLAESHKPMMVEMRITGVGTAEIKIGDEDRHPYSVKMRRNDDSYLCFLCQFNEHGYTKSGIRTYYVAFKVKDSEYLSMMCR